MAKFNIQNLQPLKGMHDIIPSDQIWWEKARKEFQYIVDTYNFMRIDTPLLERSEVFERTLGETSDIVEKQMFSFKNSSGDNLVLRPEATASIVRAYIQHGLSHMPQPLRLFYIGPMFRKEQPQAGRFRQFHQAGMEILGGDCDPIYDAQIILAMYRFFQNLKIKDVVIQINSVGCRVCRPNYRKKLIEYYKNKNFKLCKDCARRLKDNPLRLLDCKNEQCQEYKAGAPMTVDNLCSNCSKHFTHVLEYLEELRLPYQLNHYLVRGLDYYSRTTFEFFTEMPAADEKKFDFAIAGGGRYDYLFEVLGKKEGVGVGAAIGLERVVEVMKAAQVNLGIRESKKIFFIHIGDFAKKRSLTLIEQLREDGIKVVESLGKDSLGAQLRSANKEGVDYALIFGQKEAFEDSIILRDLKNGVQETVPLKKIVNEVKRRI